MGNVYMEAEQVRYKNATYPNVSLALDKALEGGGGGGTTVVANPVESATADLAKLQVGETIYGIPADASDISYDNTASGMTADDVQEAIDELNTGVSGITELIPSDATSSNKLATADDIPDLATTSAAGIVQPDGTTITVSNGVISAASSGGLIYSETEHVVGTWLGSTLYAKTVSCGAMPAATTKTVNANLPTGAIVVRMDGISYVGSSSFNLPYADATANANYNFQMYLNNGVITIKTTTDQSHMTNTYITLYYIKTT